MKYFRAHPVTIIANLRHVLFLALVPLLHGGFVGLFAIALMLGIAVWLWLRIDLRLKDDCLELRTGLIRRQTLRVSMSRVTMTSFFQHFSLAPFKAVRFSAETLDGKRLSVILAQKRADCLKPRISAPKKGYRPTYGKIAALSLLTSNSFGGILYLATFVSQSGKLLGREFSGAVHAALERAASLLHIGLALGLPPAAEGAAVLLLAGWLVGFGRMFLRCSGFVLWRQGERLTVSGGFLSRYEHCFRRKDIFYADIRQSLLTKLLKLYSLYIRGMCCFFTEKAASFEKTRGELLPEFSPAPRQIKPGLGSLPRFIGLPLAALLAIWPAFWLIARVYPAFAATFGFAAVMAAALAGWFLAVKFVDFCSAGAAFDGINYTLRYSKCLSFHTVIIPKGHITAFELRRSPLMRHGPYCDLVVRIKGKTRFTCKGLVNSEAIQFIREV